MIRVDENYFQFILVCQTLHKVRLARRMDSHCLWKFRNQIGDLASDRQFLVREVTGVRVDGIDANFS